MSKWTSRALWALIVFNLAAAIPLFFFYFEPDPVLTVRDEVWQDQTGKPTSVFRPGDTAYAMRTACSTKKAQFTVGRKLQCDGAVNALLESGAGMIERGCFPYAISAAIPASISIPTTCHYISSVQTTVNGLRAPATTTITSAPFRVQ